MTATGKPLPTHTPDGAGRQGLFERGRAGRQELEDRARSRHEQEPWSTPRPKQVDTLRLATLNTANNLSPSSDWLLARAAMEERADVVGFQETGVAQHNETWKKELEHAAKQGTGSKEARVSQWSSHQAGSGRWVGGVATLTMGEMTARSRDTPDVRGWGRYGTTTIRGRGGRNVAVINVYIRNDAESEDGTDAKLSTVLRARASAVTSGIEANKWKPGDAPPRPSSEQVKNPMLLLWDDIEMEFGKFAAKEKNTLVIMGDFNVDPVRGDQGAKRVARLCEALGLVHGADKCVGEQMARRVTTRCARTGGENGEQQRPSHLDHILVSTNAAATTYFVTDAMTLGATDHALVVLDLCTQATLGITEDGARAPGTVKRKVARARWADGWYRENFMAFAERHYLKHEEKHGIREAAEAIEHDPATLARAARGAVHTAEWAAERWRRPEESRQTIKGHTGRETEEAKTLRERISDLAQRLDDFAMATDKAYVCSGGAARRRKTASEVGRGAAKKTIHVGKLWSAVKAARLSVRRYSAEQTLEMLRAPIITEGADRALPASAEQAIAQAVWQGKPGQPEEVLLAETTVTRREQYLRDAERAVRQQLHSRHREQHTLEEGGKQAAELRNRKEQLRKEHVSRLLERKRAGVLSTVAVETEDGTRLLRNPKEQAAHTAEFAGPRFSTAQGKVFIKTDLRAGDRARLGTEVMTVEEAKQDGSFTLRSDSGEMHRAAWAELRRVNPDDSEFEAYPGGGECDDNVLPLFRRNADGESRRQRLVDGEATEQDWESMPAEFRTIEPALRRKQVNGEPVSACHYTRLFDSDKGELRGITRDEWMKHLRGAKKGKSPGYSGITTDLIAMMPAPWHDAAVKMIGAILATGISPRTWHIDLVNYIHKGGDDQTLANHRPIKLLELMRKLVLGILTFRLKKDWEELGMIDKTNSGSQAGRSTANALLPVRAAMEQARCTGKAAAVLYDDLKWAFDTPARTVLDLAARRMGVPEQFMQLLEDIDSRSVQTTILSAGLAMDLSEEGSFRQLHGTGQGGVEGPMLWLMLSDIVVTRARQVDAKPAVLKTTNGWTKVGERWFVDDSALSQVASTREEAAAALEELMNATGLVYVLLGMERRPTKCHLVLAGRGREESIAIRCKQWRSRWDGDRLSLVEGEPFEIKQEPKGTEVRYLGLTDSEAAGTTKARAVLTATARRAAKVYAWTQSLHHMGRAFAQGVLAPKMAYPMSFSKATHQQLEELEGTYGTMHRHALGLRAGTAWDVMESATGEAGAGAERLTTVVLKQRISHLLRLSYGGTRHEAAVAEAIIDQGQRWMGEDKHILEDAPALREKLVTQEGVGPWVIGVAAELAKLDIAVSMHHKMRPWRADDEPIMTVARRRLGARAECIQRWRRDHWLFWVSEMHDAAGRITRLTRDRIDAERHKDARAWSALTEAFVATEAPAVKLGPPTQAAWAGAEVGKVGAVGGVLMVVSELGQQGAVMTRLRREGKTKRGGARKWTVEGEPVAVMRSTVVVWADSYNYDGTTVLVTDGDEACELTAPADVGQCTEQMEQTIRGQDSSDGQAPWVHDRREDDTMVPGVRRARSAGPGVGRERAKGGGNVRGVPATEAGKHDGRREQTTRGQGSIDMRTARRHDESEDGALKSRAAEAMTGGGDEEESGREVWGGATYRHFEWYYRKEAATERPLAVTGVPLEGTPEFVAAVAAVRDATARLDGSEAKTWAANAVCVYSDGSVEGAGVIGAAAMAVKIGRVTVTMGMRMATFDVPLSSNRTEWGGATLAVAVMTAADVRQRLELRLDNLNVVKQSNRLEEAAEQMHIWLEMQDRDLAETFGWWLGKRKAENMGDVVIIHQPGHPERRKKREEFDEHEIMNDVVDHATHQLHPNQLVYGGFDRPARGFRMWVVPQKDEGLEQGERVEVTGPPLRYIRKRAAKLAARRRRLQKHGDFVGGHMASMVGWSETTKVPAESIKFYQEQLATEAVKNMYQGLQRRARCPCGRTYRHQGHGFLRCPLVAGARAAHVEEQRKTILEHTSMVGVADAVANAYQVGTSGEAVQGEAAMREQQWTLHDWAPGDRERARAMGSTAAVSEGRKTASWPEPRPSVRARIEDEWSAGKDYDHDGLLEEEDPRQAMHERFRQYATVGGRKNWWTMRWTEMSVVYLAQLTHSDVGEMKSLTRKLRKNTEKWWRAAWNEWRAADVGLEGVSGVERKTKLLEGWAAARDILGEGYRSATGERMAAATTMATWNWVRIGQRLKAWMTADAKATIERRIVENHDRYGDQWERLQQAGVRTSSGDDSEDEHDAGSSATETGDSGEDTSDETVDLTEDITYLRKWDGDGDRKRTANEVMQDETETAENRAMAEQWMQARAEQMRKKRKTAGEHRRGRQGRQTRKGAAARAKHRGIRVGETTMNTGWTPRGSGWGGGDPAAAAAGGGGGGGGP